MSNTEKSNRQKAAPASTIKKIIRKETAVSKEVSVTLKAEDPQVHYLKLQPLFRESRSRLLHKPSPRIVPELRLSGNWLEQAGFGIEDYVSVTVMDGLLIIRSAEAENK